MVLMNRVVVLIAFTLGIISCGPPESPTNSPETPKPVVNQENPEQPGPTPGPTNNQPSNLRPEPEPADDIPSPPNNTPDNTPPLGDDTPNPPGNQNNSNEPESDTFPELNAKLASLENGVKEVIQPLYSQAKTGKNVDLAKNLNLMVDVLSGVKNKIPSYKFQEPRQGALETAIKKQAVNLSQAQSEAILTAFEKAYPLAKGVKSQTASGLSASVYKAITDHPVGQQLAKADYAELNTLFTKVSAISAKRLRSQTDRDKEVETVVKAAVPKLRQFLSLSTLTNLFTGVSLSVEEQQWADAINDALEGEQNIGGSNAVAAKASFMPQSVYNIVRDDKNLSNAQMNKMLDYIKANWVNFIKNTNRISGDSRKEYPVYAVSYALSDKTNTVLNSTQQSLADRLTQVFGEEYVPPSLKPTTLSDSLFKAASEFKYDGKDISTRIKNRMISAFTVAAERILTPPAKLRAISDGLKDALAKESNKDEIMRDAVKLFQFTELKSGESGHWLKEVDPDKFLVIVEELTTDGAIVKDGVNELILLPKALNNGIPLVKGDKILLNFKKSLAADYTVPGTSTFGFGGKKIRTASGDGFVGFRYK